MLKKEKNLNSQRIRFVIMSIVEKIDPISLAKVQALIGFSVGIIFGLLIYVVEKAIPTSQQDTLPTYGSSILIIGPMAGLIYGFLGGLIIALLYNLFSKMVGGIKLTFKEK